MNIQLTAQEVKALKLLLEKFVGKDQFVGGFVTETCFAIALHILADIHAKLGRGTK